MKKRFLLTSLLMLLLTLTAVCTSTYAWFTMSSEVYVNEFNVTTVETTGGMDISTDGSTWATDKKATVNTSNIAYDLTSDKDGQIYWRDGSNDNLKVADPSQYNTFYLYFKTNSYGTIQLELGESYIVPNAYKDLVKNGDTFKESATFVNDAITKEGILATTEGYDTVTKVKAIEGSENPIQHLADADFNKSASGDISRDWIAAAYRMSFKVVGFQSSTSSSYTNGVDTLPATLSEEGKAVKFAKALPTAYLTKNNLSGKYSIEAGSENAIDGVSLKSGTVGESSAIYKLDNTVRYTASTFLTHDATINIATISAQNGDLPFTQGNTYIVKLECKIWCEGQDNEAQLPLTAGKVAAALKFNLAKNVADPTDYRTKVGFTGVGTTEGLTWTAPISAIKDNKILLYKDLEAAITNSTTALPSNPIELAANASSYTTGTFTAEQVYYLVAQVDITADGAGTTGFKADNYFTDSVSGKTYIWYQIIVA